MMCLCENLLTSTRIALSVARVALCDIDTQKHTRIYISTRHDLHRECVTREESRTYVAIRTFTSEHHVVIDAGGTVKANFTSGRQGACVSVTGAKITFVSVTTAATAA